MERVEFVDREEGGSNGTGGGWSLWTGSLRVFFGGGGGGRLVEEDGREDGRVERINRFSIQTVRGTEVVVAK